MDKQATTERTCAPMHFEATHYQRSGRFQPAALLHGLGAMLLCAGAGCVYQILHGLSPFLILNVFFVGGLAFVIEGQTKRVLVLGHVRNLGVAVLLAVGIALSALLASYAWEFFRDIRSTLMVRPELSWADMLQGSVMGRWLQFTAETGWTMTRHNSKIRVNGMAVYALWAIEALILLGTSLLQTSHLKALPYCEDCRRWTATDRVNLPGLGSDAVEPLLRAGDLDGVLTLKSPESPDDSVWLSLLGHTCPGCQKTWLTVSAGHEERQHTGKKRIVTRRLTENLVITPRHQRQLLERIQAESPARAA